MVTCSQCASLINDDAIQLRDGTRMCAFCFDRRYRPPVAARKSPADIVDRIKIALLAILICGIGTACYSIVKDQNEPVKPEPALLAVLDQQAAARQHAQEAYRAAFALAQKSAREQNQLAQVQLDAAAQVARERAAADWLERKAAIEKGRLTAAAAIADMKRRNQARELAASNRQDEDAKKRLDRLHAEEDLARLNEKLAARDRLESIRSQFNAALAQHADDERKMTGFKMRYDTHSRAMQRITQKHGGIPKTTSERQYIHTYVISPNPDALADWATYQVNEHEAELDTDAISRLTVDMADHAAVLDKLQQDFDDAKRVLSELGTPADTPGLATPFDLPVPALIQPERRPLKTLYKKDGSSISVRSAITVGDETRYRDAAGIPGTVRAADVDRIE